MFLGRHQHSLDSKGRLAIPARFRTGFADGLVLTRGIDRCIAVYPMTAWTELADKIAALSMTDADARTFRRLVFAEAVDGTPDGQGRVVIPPELRAYAEIDRGAIVVGVHSSVEIWSPARWAAVQSHLDDDGTAVAERLATLI